MDKRIDKAMIELRDFAEEIQNKTDSEKALIFLVKDDIATGVIGGSNFITEKLLIEAGKQDVQFRDIIINAAKILMLKKLMCGDCVDCSECEKNTDPSGSIIEDFINKFKSKF